MNTENIPYKIYLSESDALEFIIDLCRGAELFLEAIRAHQRRRAVHLVEIADLLRDGDIRRVVVQLLLDQLVTENGAQIVKAHGLAGARVHPPAATS